MRKDVAEWPEDWQYKAGIKTCKIIADINDCSEQGVKLAADFRPSPNPTENL